VRNKLAEICEKYLTKGDRVYCEGRIKTRQYEVDGQKRYTTEIHVQDMTFLSTKKDPNDTQSNTEPTQGSPNPTPPSVASEEDDDLPF